MRRARSLFVAGLLAALALSPLATTAPHAAASDDGGRAGLSPVRATLQLSPDQSVVSGRVISKDTSCKKKVAVHLFAQLGDDLEYAGVFITDAQGRWSSEDGPVMRRLASVELFAVVPGEKGCRVAQSKSQKLTSTRAGRASRSITIDFRQDGLEGRVTSPKASCEKQAPIAFFYRESNQQPWQFGDTDRTNNNGRYRYDFDEISRSAWRTARATAPVIAVALADKQCAVAQSAPAGLPAM